MTWCELNGVDYLFGLARNERLVGAIAQDLVVMSMPHHWFGRSGLGFWVSTLRLARSLTRATSLPTDPNRRIFARRTYSDAGFVKAYPAETQASLRPSPASGYLL
jgi:hypothetical protein